MRLFDDILKKPQEKAPVDLLVQWGGGTPPPGSGTGSSGWQPHQDDGTQVIPAPVFIQKTTETSLFDTSPRVDMSDLRIQENAPIVTTQAESNTDTLLVSMPRETIQENTVSILAPAEEMHPLFGSPESSTIETIEPTVSIPPVTPPEVTSTDSLFSMGKDDGISENSFFSPVPEVEEKKIEKILHPKEFLERSIESIDSMIADIDTAYDKKVTEAESYAQEKERLATLEKDTYDEASKLSEEKEHALHVRKLLDKELWSNKKKDTKDTEVESFSWFIQGKGEVPTPPVETPLVANDAIVVQDTLEAPTVEAPVIIPEVPVSEKKTHTEKVEDALPVAV